MKTINDIPCGHFKPLPRLYNPFEDRKLRKQIETANTKDDCIINVGNGYYIPVPGDPVDEKELHRARAILKKRLNMKMTFERWRKVGVPTDNTGTTG